MLRYVAEHHSNYQYIYSLLFPKHYLQHNKYGVQSRIKFAVCFDNRRQQKMNEEIGKHPFNFSVPEVVRHLYEQRPITNDDEFRADVVDTKKISTENKENIPPSNQRFLYAPTMVSIIQFDNQYKLPKVKKPSKTALEKAEQRKKKTEHLKLRLGEIDEKMKVINKNNNKKN